jgi:hypothetical protein
MNVLYVGTLPPHPGGTAVFGEYLLAGLSALGHSVRAVAPTTQEALTGGRAAIHAQVPALVADERPDVVIMGRESFAWHVPDVAQNLGLRSALLVHGGTMGGIMTGTLPPETGRHLLSQ